MAGFGLGGGSGLRGLAACGSTTGDPSPSLTHQPHAATLKAVGLSA